MGLHRTAFPPLRYAKAAVYAGVMLPRSGVQQGFPKNGNGEMFRKILMISQKK
jgi:hypothetical protein